MVDTTTNSSSIGQQTPFDSNTDLTQIFFVCRQLIALIDTMIPVQVIAVHLGSGSPPIAGTVDVQLLVSQLDGAGNSTPSGTINKLPYFRQQGGPWTIILDPGVNDYGYIIGASRDISNVAAAAKAGNSQATPGSYRKYSFSDGIYQGGCFNAVPAASFWLKPDGTFEISDSKGNVLQSSPNGLMITGNVKVTGTLEATQIQTDDAGLTVTGNISATGTITAGKGGADQVSLQTHLHGGVTTGAGSTAAPTAGT